MRRGLGGSGGGDGCKLVIRTVRTSIVVITTPPRVLLLHHLSFLPSLPRYEPELRRCVQWFKESCFNPTFCSSLTSPKSALFADCYNVGSRCQQNQFDQKNFYKVGDLSYAVRSHSV